MTTIALDRNTAIAAEPAARRGSPRRIFTWELASVLTLLGSSAAYAVSALLHLA